MMDVSRVAGYRLLEQAIGLEVEILDTDVQPTPEDVVTTVRFQIPEDDLETCEFGILFALSVLSFADARPRGISDMDFEDDDTWSLDDFLQGLSYRHGELHFDADYVRGRLVKTSIKISKTGEVRLQTVHRGTAATRWVDRLRGKKPLRLVPDP